MKKSFLPIIACICSLASSVTYAAPMNWVWAGFFPWVYSHDSSEWLWSGDYPWLYSATTQDWTYNQSETTGDWEFQNGNENLRFTYKASNIDSSIETALEKSGGDYIEGYLTGDTTLMSSSLHSAVVIRAPGNESFIDYTLTDRSTEAQSNSGTIADGDVSVTVLDQIQNTALIRIDHPNGYEHAQVARIEGEWIILNTFYDEWDPTIAKSQRTLTTEEIKAQITAEKEALVAAGMNYVEGFFTGDTDRMKTSLHENLVKRQSVSTSWGFKGMTRATLLSYASKQNDQPGDNEIEITILDVVQDTALIRVDSPKFYDYCQLYKIDGHWWIVNVLWDMWD